MSETRTSTEPLTFTLSCGHNDDSTITHGVTNQGYVPDEGEEPPPPAATLGAGGRRELRRAISSPRASTTPRLIVPGATVRRGSLNITPNSLTVPGSSARKYSAN